MGSAKRVVANIDEIDLKMERLIRSLPPLPPIALERLSRWIRSNLRRHVIHELDCASPCAILDANAPEWLKQACLSGSRAHRVELTDALMQLLNGAVVFLIPLANRREVDRIDPKPLINRAMAQALSQIAAARGVAAGAPQERCALALPNGRRWMELLDGAALAREGSAMRHCAGAYEEDRRLGLSRIFSLRDIQGRPRLTLEAQGLRVTQVKGKAQSPVKRADWPDLEAFLRHGLEGRPLRAPDCPDLPDSGCVWDERLASLCAIELLPAGWLFKHDVRLWRHGARSIPPGSRIAGRLSVEPDWTGSLPEAFFAEKAVFNLTRPFRVPRGALFGELEIICPSVCLAPARCALSYDFTQAPLARLA